MTVIQNPTVPNPIDPIEIDRAIQDISIKLSTNLTWLSNGYGRAYQHIDATQDGRRFYPQVYLGTQTNSQRYTIVTPDNDKQGQCFFFVTRETVNNYQVGQYPYLTYNVAIIFSLNLETIDSALLATDYFMQNKVAEVRKVFIEEVLGVPYQVTLGTVDYLYQDVFREFDVEQQEQIEKAPFTHFRYNTTITLQAECNTLPFDRCTAVLNNLSQDDIDCICGDPVIAYENTHSLLFNGVNDYVEWPDTTPWNFDYTQPKSISVWIKISSYVQGEIFAKFGPIFTGIQYRTEPDGSITYLEAFNVGNRLIAQTDPAIVPFNVWTHVAVTDDGSGTAAGINFYINGVSVTTNSVQSPISVSMINGNPPRLGSTGTNLANFSGYMTEFRMWLVEQNAAFILDDYNGGKPKEAEDNANALGLPRFGPGASWQDLYINWRFMDDSTNDPESFQTGGTIKAIRTTDIPV